MSADLFPEPEQMTLLGLCAGCSAVTNKRAQVADCPEHGPAYSHVCCPCWDRTQAILAELGRKRDFLVSNGVPIEKANAVMDKRIAEIEWPW